jgi:uncharacterized metal-binding protein YceD (DUF177 family)
MKKRNDNPFGNEFIISFAGLNQGKHYFDFKINEKFFEQYNNDEITSAQFEVNIEMVTQSTVLTLNFDINGLIRVPCDRCADTIEVPIYTTSELIVKLGSSEQVDNDDVLALPLGETEINVANHIYEYVVLALPARRVHPDDENGNSGCDPETIKKLEELNVKPETEEIDPRWEKLKALKFKN